MKGLQFLFLFFCVLYSKGQALQELTLHISPPIKRELKIEKIKKKYKDMYFIYASCNDTTYKIVSYIDPDIKYGEELQVGGTYTLWIRQFFDSMDSMIGELHVVYAGHFIGREVDKNVVNPFYSPQLSGKRIINDSSEDYDKMGVCPELGLDPYYVKRLRDESHGKFGQPNSDPDIIVLRLSRYESEDYPPVQKKLRIKKIEQKFRDMYIIVASCNDTTYTILSRYQGWSEKQKKLKVGKTYSLKIQPLCPRTINGKDPLPSLDRGYYFANHYVALQPHEDIRNFYTTEDLSGNYLFDASSIEAIDPHHVKVFDIETHTVKEVDLTKDNPTETPDYR